MKLNLFIKNARRLTGARAFSYLFALMMAIAPFISSAHQALYSVAYLDVNPKSVSVELHIPLSELALAYGNQVNQDQEHLISRMGPQLKEYILAHTHAFTTRDFPWLVNVRDLHVIQEEQLASGPPFFELRAQLQLSPQHREDTRHFFFDYDGVVHQVVNHIVFVVVRNDWETGRADSLTADSNPMTIRTGNDNLIHPLEIKLENGSTWTGFKNMLVLGMHHIKEGTDHLLFLVALLLPAMLLKRKNSWGGYGGIRYSLKNILKIVTAFTIGHSITLLIGAMNWINLPSQPIEVIIAVSILISAVHAIYPIFPRKEILIAGGFGLIHGLAFSSILANLHVGGSTLLLSVLGFNIGIELMQLIVVMLIMPWLVLLSQTPFYKYIRIGGAVLASVAALGWIVERVSGESNIIAQSIIRLSGISIWLLTGLVLIAFLGYFISIKTRTEKFKKVLGQM